MLKRTDSSDKAAMLHQLLKLTNRLMAPFSTHLAHRYRISLNEFRLLMTTGALGRTASHELAELTGVNVMSVSRAVATLQRHGRIEVVRDPANRRRKWLSLTEEGQRLYELMRPQSEKVAEYLFSDLEPAEVEQLATILTRLIDTLEATDGVGEIAVHRTHQAVTEEQRRAIEIDCERLIKRYVNLNDAQDWPAVASLYTEDARFARPSQPGVFVEGRAAILASFLARPARAQRHVIANVVVEVEDADHASAFSVIVLYQGTAAAPGDLPAMDPKSPLVGTFTDRLVRTRDGWRFAERVGGLDFRP